MTKDDGVEKYPEIIRNQNKSSADTVAYYLADLEAFCCSVLYTTDKE